MGSIPCAGGVFAAIDGTGKVYVVVVGVVVSFEAIVFRPRAEGSCVVGKRAGREAVDKGGAKFAGTRGGFANKCGEVVGGFLGVTVLVVLVVLNVAWLSVVARGCG